MKFLKFSGLVALLCLVGVASHAQNNASREAVALKDSLLGSVFFDSDRHELRNEARIQLKTLAQQLQKMPNVRILLKGNTDADGSQTYNQRLSEKRVAAVRQFLEREGASLSNVQTDALGEVKPIANNHTETGKQRNRRVEVWLMRSQHPSVTVSKNGLETDATANAFDFDAKKSYLAATFMQSLASPIQRFKIHPNQTSFLKGEKGTLLRFGAGTFNTTNNDSVEITLREVYSKADIVMNNFNSVSDGKMLITGGMLEINAFQNGRELTAQKPYLMMMPPNVNTSVCEGYSNKPQEKGEPAQRRGNRMQLFVTNPQAPQTLPNGFAAPMNWTLPTTKNVALWATTQFDAEIATCKADLDYLHDTCGCHKLITWRLDSLFIQKMQKAKKDISHLPNIVVSDKKPENYTYLSTNRDSSYCRLTLDLAELIAKENHSYTRRIDWKMKHLYLMPAVYDKYEANHYDQLDSCINRRIRILTLAKETYKETQMRYAVNYYIFETAALRKINCDFFRGQNDIMPLWAVDLPSMPQIQYKIVFAKQRVVLDANPTIGGSVKFSNIPSNELVTLIGMRVRDGKMEMAAKKIQTGKKLEGAFKYKVYADRDAIKDVLNSIVNADFEHDIE